MTYNLADRCHSKVLAIIGRVGILLFAVILLRAQSTADKSVIPPFEKIQFEEHKTGTGRSHFNFGRGKIDAENVSLRDFIAMAYSIKDYQVSGPSWMALRRYNLQAQSSPLTTESILREMVRKLLQESFSITFRKTQARIPVYLLTKGQTPPSLKAVASGPSRSSWAPGAFSATRSSLPQLADMLSRHMRRPVLDRTSIDGTFAINLQYGSPNGTMPSPGSDPLIVLAIENQLGLNLRSATEIVEFVTADALEPNISRKVPLNTGSARPLPNVLRYICPMDPDERSASPGKCRRCGMPLTVGSSKSTEYSLNIRTQPTVLRANADLELRFTVRDSLSERTVTSFEPIHEKVFHLFVVSEDLQYFVHEHPTKLPDASFLYKTRLPFSGMYRMLTDFYPTGGTPQLIPGTIFASGRPNPARHPIEEDLGAKQATNLGVRLIVSPQRPVAGFKTTLTFQLDPVDGLQTYLGAWAHMLIGSDDLIDLIHDHPSFADGGGQVHFSVVFPRPRMYRLWVQFQRHGVVNTVAFNIHVGRLG